MATTTVDGESRTTRHRARNISSTGASITNGKTFFVGQLVNLSIGKISAIEAKILWVEADTAGLQFENAIAVEHALRSGK